MNHPLKIPVSCEEAGWNANRFAGLLSGLPDTCKYPRTCGFCGSVHLEDLILLVQAGWTPEPTTKNYKFYVNPPADLDARHKGSMPIMKFYTNHLTKEGAETLNNILKERKNAAN